MPIEGFMGGLFEAQRHQADMAQQTENTRLLRMQIDKTMQDLKNEKAIDEAVSAAGIGTLVEKDPVQAMLKTAGILTQQGQPEKAMEIASKAVNMQQTLAQEKRLKLAQDLEMAGSAVTIMSNIVDQASLTRAAEYAAANGLDPLGVIQELNQRAQRNGYSQETIDDIKNRALSAKERLGIEVANLQLDTERLRQEELSFKTDSYWPSVIRLNNARAVQARKAGDVGTRGKSVLFSRAKDRVTREYSSEIKGEVETLAARVAEIANDLIRANPSLDHTQAIDAAFTQMKLGLSFAGLDPSDVAEGSRPDVPMASPVTKKGELDMEQLQDNKFYKSPTGVVAVWHAARQKFFVAGTPEFEALSLADGEGFGDIDDEMEE